MPTQLQNEKGPSTKLQEKKAGHKNSLRVGGAYTYGYGVCGIEGGILCSIGGMDMTKS